MRYFIALLLIPWTLAATTLIYHLVDKIRTLRRKKLDREKRKRKEEYQKLVDVGKWYTPVVNIDEYARKEAQKRPWEEPSGIKDRRKNETEESKATKEDRHSSLWNNRRSHEGYLQDLKKDVESNAEE